MTLADLLRDRAARYPDRDLLRMSSRRLTFTEFDLEVDRVAAGLLAAGVNPGEAVGVMMRNCPEFAILWLACMRVGAVEAPVNTAFRGAGLQHLVDLCGCKLLFIDDEFLPALAEVRHGLDRLERVITRAELSEAFKREPHPVPAVDPSLPAQIFFTSGTTGRSKACVFDGRYAVRHAENFVREYEIREDDVLYNPFPLFHIDASVLTLAPAIVRGCTAALGERFSATRFWEEVDELGATVFDYMGATLTMLWKAEPRPDDKSHSPRLGWGVPMPDFAPEFEERFGLRLVEGYGLTDAGVPVFHPLSQPRRPGSCGKVVSEYDMRIADDGEILLRAKEPGLLTLGYLGDPEATAAAFEGGWFKTGDIGRIDDEGWVYFLGRKKDSIRRRGENIASFEVEEVVEAHPAVLEAAAYGVPSDLTEEDVMVTVALRPGAELAPTELVAWCEARMGRHMVPRYVEFVTSLPRTPTEKVEKYRLRERGVTAGTWDRLAATNATTADRRRPEHH